MCDKNNLLYGYCILKINYLVLILILILTLIVNRDENLLLRQRAKLLLNRYFIFFSYIGKLKNIKSYNFRRNRILVGI